MKKNYDFLIVGAGLFGSVCAYELNKRGYKVLVVEKRNNVAGTIYTEEIEGIQVHKFGPHIFHTSNKDTWNYINQFAKFNNFINSPLAFYKGKYYNMPFNMNTFHQVFGVDTAEEARACIEKEIKAANIKEPKNLEEKAISMVGTTIYEMLIKGYTQKQWGKPCNELPPSIISRIYEDPLKSCGSTSPTFSSKATITFLLPPAMPYALYDSIRSPCTRTRNLTVLVH